MADEDDDLAIRSLCSWIEFWKRVRMGPASVGPWPAYLSCFFSKPHEVHVGPVERILRLFELRPETNLLRGGLLICLARLQECQISYAIMMQDQCRLTPEAPLVIKSSFSSRTRSTSERNFLIVSSFSFVTKCILAIWPSGAYRISSVPRVLPELKSGT